MDVYIFLILFRTEGNLLDELEDLLDADPQAVHQALSLQHFHLVRSFPVLLRNRLISAGLAEPVLNQKYYYDFSFYLLQTAVYNTLQ